MSAALPIAAAASMVALDDYAFLELEGTRVLTLLQGQLTCDVKRASADRLIEGAYCTPKGRVISNFLLWAADSERVLLRMHASVVEPTATVLARYAALSRVNLTRKALVCTGLLGSKLAETAGTMLGNWPQHRLQIVPVGEHLVLQCDDAGRRHEIWSPPESAPRLREALAAHCPIIPPMSWRLALIRERKVDIVPAICDEFLPQMLEYDRSEAVSFRKGCYTGQEIVARAHYKGALKRRLYHLGATTTNCPAPGEVLYGSDAARAAGSVVASASDEGRVEVLAVLSEDTEPLAARELRSADGSVFEVLAAPCAILE